jgi:hypothetical protein
VVRDDREVYSRVCVWAPAYDEDRERGVQRELKVNVNVDTSVNVSTNVEGTWYNGSGTGSGSGTGTAKETVIEAYKVTIPAVHAYADVDFAEGWNLPAKKTLYVKVPEGTTEAEAQAIANQLATRIADVGIVESFAGPIRPQLQPGDQASIWEPGKIGRLLGVLTEVGHQFGRNGFYTSFTVDSGGMLRKPAIRDLVDIIAGQREISGNVRRLDLEEEE